MMKMQKQIINSKHHHHNHIIIIIIIIITLKDLLMNVSGESITFGTDSTLISPQNNSGSQKHSLETFSFEEVPIRSHLSSRNKKDKKSVFSSSARVSMSPVEEDANSFICAVTAANAVAASAAASATLECDSDILSMTDDHSGADLIPRPPSVVELASLVR
jgi:hypothetical protein